MRKRRDGFTLIEALMASALLMVLLVQLGQIQNSARLALDRVRRATGMSLAGQATTQATAGDMATAQQQLVTDCENFLFPGFLEKGQPALDITNVGGDSSSGRLVFYTAEYWPAGAQEIRKVTWSLAEGGLERLSQPAVPKSGLRQERRQVMVAGAKGLQVGLFDGKAFVSSWAGKQGLPQGVRLEFVDSNKKSHTWERRFNGALE